MMFSAKTANAPDTATKKQIITEGDLAAFFKASNPPSSFKHPLTTQHGANFALQTMHPGHFDARAPMNDNFENSQSSEQLQSTHYDVMHYAVLCYGMLCYGVTCYAMLSCAMLCCATIHYAVL